MARRYDYAPSEIWAVIQYVRDILRILVSRTTFCKPICHLRQLVSSIAPPKFDMQDDGTMAGAHGIADQTW